MTRGDAHILKVVMLATDAYALLRAGCARGGCCGASDEHILEGRHTSVDEHERWVVRGHEAARRHNAVTLPMKKIEKAAAQAGASAQAFGLWEHLDVSHEQRRV